MSRQALAFGAVVFVLSVVVAGLLVALRYDLPLERRAATVAAQVAFGTQMVAFAVARIGIRSHMVAAWGAGTLIRVAALVVWGLVAALALRWPAEPALVTAALILFLSTMIEPLFLKTT